MNRVLSILCALFLVCPMFLYAQPSDDLSDVYQDPAAFDGGPGSTLNDPPPVAIGPLPDVPEVGPASPVELSSGTAPSGTTGLEEEEASGETSGEGASDTGGEAPADISRPVPDEDSGESDPDDPWMEGDSPLELPPDSELQGQDDETFNWGGDTFESE